MIADIQFVNDTEEDNSEKHFHKNYKFLKSLRVL